MANTNNSTKDRELSVSRILNAPRELVFKVWTEPEHIAKWWGPVGFTNTISKMDVKPGGEWVFVMHGPDGTDFKNHSVYVEVVKPERIVFNHISPNFQATATFKEVCDKTELTWTMVFESAADLQKVVSTFKADVGLRQNVDKLEQYLSDATGKKPFTIVREFDAPRAVVYRALSEAKELAQWWGPAGFKMDVKKFEFQPGGVFHYSMQAPDGKLLWGKFIYRDMLAPERIEFVNAFSDEQGNTARNPFLAAWPLEILNTVVLTENDGKTTLTMSGFPINATAEETALYEGPAMQGGMQQGFKGTFDKLEEYLSNKTQPIN